MKQQPNAQGGESLPVLPWRWVVVATVTMLVVTAVTVWSLLAFARSNRDPNQTSTELQALRTALSVTVGAGGAFALWLATRRQRSAELQIRENARIAHEVREHEAAVAKSNEEDARERRVTELYTAAVGQLGSDKAPVRLGGLYALERLASQNPEHQQTIVNVICAYLRMPFGKPLDKLEGTYYSGHRLVEIESDKESSEELQVRVAAQRILEHNLSTLNEGPQWKEIKVDLQGATLFEFSLDNCEVRSANFMRANFVGVSTFYKTKFKSMSWFSEAIFCNTAFFSGCSFNDGAVFVRTFFVARLKMVSAIVKTTAQFPQATFGSSADFSSVELVGGVTFEEARLRTDHYPDFKMSPLDWPEPKFIFDGASLTEPPSEDFNPFSSQRQLPEGWLIGEDGHITTMKN